MYFFEIRMIIQPPNELLSRSPNAKTSCCYSKQRRNTDVMQAVVSFGYRR